MSTMNVSIYHNIVWSKYKGVVFTELNNLAKLTNLNINFFQIAETENDRIGLSSVDYTYHDYPFVLLFKGSYNQVSKSLLIKTLFFSVFRSKSNLILLPGFSKIEFWVMLLAARLKKKKIGLFCDSTAYDRPQVFIKGLLKRLFISQCDCFFVYGIRSLEYLSSYGADSSKIFFRCQAAALVNGYDPTVIPHIRKSLVPASNSPSFLYVGRISKEKNLKTLLHAFKELSLTTLNATLVIVGDGPEKNELCLLSEKLGISHIVEFTGSKNGEDLISEYLRASCLILPSTSEPWGLVVNEALSYGCPVIVSNRCGCVPDLVKDGINGYVFIAEDVTDLKNKLSLFINNFTDPLIIANECLSVISAFTPDLAAKQILDGCNSILSEID